MEGKNILQYTDTAW